MDNSQIKVLIVDDEEMVQKNLNDFLEDDGFIVTTASSAEEGLELVSNHKYDVAIVDMRLPGIDGNAFIIEAHKIDNSLKFCVHTGSTNYILPEQIAAIGVKQEQIFNKPLLDMNVLSTTINSIVRGK